MIDRHRRNLSCAPVDNECQPRCWSHLAPLASSLNTQVCGVGNSPRAYYHHRHSIGLFLLDVLRTRLRYPDWENDRKFNGYWSNPGGPCVLFKPKTYVNTIGRPISKAFARFQSEHRNGRLCVIYDDLELPVGTAKLQSRGRGRLGFPAGTVSC